MKSLKRLQERSDRRATRYSRVGRDLEERVAGVLHNLLSEGLIYAFQKHEAHSAEDQDGKDFTVQKIVSGEVEERSFGVTISHRSWCESKIKHPDHLQFCFPVGTNQETIKKRILSLFPLE